MVGEKPQDGLQLQSNAKSSGVLEISLARVPVPDPAPDEVVIRIEATPINPSDLGLLIGAADPSTARAVDTHDLPVTQLDIPPAFMRAIAARIDEALPVGNEGAGTVVAAGDQARDLLGKTVALAGGAMYAQYRVAKAAELMVLPDGVTAAEGASPFVNPMTALAMVETMRMEGHKALVHTAAASNLGQMLVKLCLEEGVDLVNIVRSTEQAALLRGLGARHVLDSTTPDFMEQLVEALKATGATLAFDAIGGGKLASQLLTGMEQAANAAGGAYSRYGSNTYKQVYIYGGLSTAPTELTRAFGFAWGLGGFLLTPFLAKIGPEGVMRLRARVAAGLKTTFASRYSHEITLAQALDPATIAAYNKKATGEKYLIVPSR
ncbi:MAG: zinc-binding dehydrogenase [Caulobacteraceae bacterium]|nr:zinc-binding dehydrogenase [Caulobacteraceae bacterium]